MFDLHENLKGDRVLIWTERRRRPFERGMWVEIGHDREKDIMRYVQDNRTMGMQVERDEHGFWRALVLKD